MLAIIAAALLVLPPSRPLLVLHGRADGLVPAVLGTVRGHRVWFDLDTGAHQSFIDINTARRLNLPRQGRTKVAGAGKGTQTALRLKPLRIQLNDLVFEAQEPMATDLSNASTFKESGILGVDFFRAYVVQIDFRSYNVTLYDPRTYHYRGEGVAVPLIVQGSRVFVRATVAAKGVAPETHALRVDLGSNDAVDDDIVLRSPAPKQLITGGNGIGQPFATYLGRVSTLQVGPFMLHDLPSATGGVQLIGDAVWSRFTIVFDLSHSVMYMTPRKDGS